MLWERDFSPGAAAATGVGTPALGSGAVLDESDLSTVDFGAVQLLQGPLHVRVEPELDHTLVLPTLVGVSIGHLPCLPHVVLENRNARQGGYYGYLHRMTNNIKKNNTVAEK